jgi:SAM-dependent methyltransferase
MRPVTEIERIEAAYRERDAAGPSIYRYANPAYQFHLQHLEWALMRALRRQGFALEGARALEVGAGTGTYLSRLVEFGAASGVGVDLMEHRIELGRQCHPQLDLRVGNGAELEFEDGSFDLVAQFTCLSSVLDPGTRAAVAAEMWRVLAPGGLIVSYDMRPTPAVVRAAGSAYRRLRGAAHPDSGTPTRPVSKEELARLFPAAQVDARPVSLNFELAFLAARSRALAETLAHVPFLRTHLLATARKPA